MVFGDAAVGGVLAVARVGQDVVGADHPFTCEGGVEDCGSSRHAEPVEVGSAGSGQGIEHHALTRLVQDVVEEGAERRSCELYGRVGDLLNDLLKIQLRGNQSTGAVQRFQGLGLGPQSVSRFLLFRDVDLNAVPDQ